MQEQKCAGSLKAGQESDIILIRHAQSQFNKGTLTYLEQNNLELDWDSLIEMEDFNKKVSYSGQFIDCHITQHGMQQCQKARKELSKHQVDLILCSPMQRALETCREIFKGNQAPVIVHPQLMEVFRYACDVSMELHHKQKQFSQFDFSEMEKHTELWFLDMLPEHHKIKCHEHFHKHALTEYKSRQEKILELLSQKVIYESPLQMRERAWKVKQLLQFYRLKYKRIAVVSHYYTIQTIISDSFNEKTHQVSKHNEIYNAFPYWRSLKLLLKVK